MSLASEIIQDAADNIGRGSELLTTDTSITNRALLQLRSIMEDLRKRDIILEETVGSTTTTIALPTLLTDELDEPVAAREHLVNILAIWMATQSRVNLAARGVPIPSVIQSTNSLARLYRCHTIPNKVPSTLLPRGQGTSQSRITSSFFNGEALDNDTTDSTT